jgi:hypothetical protein
MPQFYTKWIAVEVISNETGKYLVQILTVIGYSESFVVPISSSIGKC